MLLKCISIANYKAISTKIKTRKSVMLHVGLYAIILNESRYFSVQLTLHVSQIRMVHLSDLTYPFNEVKLLSPPALFFFFNIG